MACADILRIPRTETYSSRQADQFYQLRTESQWTDVTIHSQGTTFQCHRVILAATSPVLKAMMLADMAESKACEITLDDIPPMVLELLINYIYKGEASIPNDQLFSATKAADFLQILEVKEYCLRRAVTVLAPSNVISWYKLADKLNTDELKSKCSVMLASSLPDVCKESEFLELSLTEMSSYMSDARDTEVDCDDLLDATLGWVDHKFDSRQKHVTNLMQKINICKCSVECLEEKIARHASLLRSQPDALMLITQGIVEVAKQSSVKKQRNKRGSKKTMAIIGGHSSSYKPNKTFWYLDPSMQFVDLCQLEKCAYGLSVCVTPDGFVVTGGEGSVLCMMFVSSTRSWKKLKSLKNPRYCHGSVFRNGRIYVLGGVVSGSKSVSVQSLDLACEEWRDEQNLPMAANNPQVACVERSIFMLKTDGKGELLCLDMDARSWRQQSQCPGKRCYGARMVTVREQLMILGGDNLLFDCYHPDSDKWTTASKPILKHNYAGAAFHEQKLYLIGGREEDRVEEYNFDSESWMVCDYKVPKKLYNLHAVVLDV